MVRLIRISPRLVSVHKQRQRISEAIMYFLNEFHVSLEGNRRAFNLNRSKTCVNLCRNLCETLIGFWDTFLWQSNHGIHLDAVLYTPKHIHRRNGVYFSACIKNGCFYSAAGSVGST